MVVVDGFSDVCYVFFFIYGLLVWLEDGWLVWLFWLVVKFGRLLFVCV